LPAVCSIDELIGKIRESGLVADSVLESFLQGLQPGTIHTPLHLATALFHAGLLTQFQAEQLLQGKSRGFTVGNYRVLERLGSGGMAVVYLCEHQVLRHRVAIKVLPINAARDVSALKRFYREARAAACVLDHPNFIRVFDIDQEPRGYFLVMEFVYGSLLRDIVLKFGPLDIHRAAHYISQTAGGLQYAHECGLVHRDIKPGNLILERAGLVKILDMGLARFLHDTEDVLTTGILGTPDYLAPEQTQDSHHVDIRAEIYSLGGTFYNLLTGETPFGKGTVAQKLLWHQVRQPTPIRQLRPEVPQEMEAIVNRMMAKNPGQRYQTPAEVVEALRPWTRTPIAPPPEQEMPRLGPAARAWRDTEPQLSLTPRILLRDSDEPPSGSRV
jgi:serine/threonine protein kinase